MEGKWNEGNLEGKCTIKIPRPQLPEEGEDKNNSNNTDNKSTEPAFITLNGTVSNGFFEVTEAKGYKLPIQLSFSPEIPIISLPTNIFLK